MREILERVEFPRFEARSSLLALDHLRAAKGPPVSLVGSAVR